MRAFIKLTFASFSFQTDFGTQNKLFLQEPVPQHQFPQIAVGRNQGRMLFQVANVESLGRMHVTFGRRLQAGQNLEQGGFAFAVRANQGNPGPVFDIEIKVRKDILATKILAQITS